MLVYQGDLPGPPVRLDLFLTRDRGSDIVRGLDVDEPRDSVPSREIALTAPVLSDSPREVVGYADIERA